MTPVTLRIFISSPGDVNPEREASERVLRHLEGRFGGVVKLEPILWEHEPMQATASFQEQILPPSQTDIVVCILWCRIGTRLPPHITRPDGSSYASGTEYELEDAALAWKRTGKPALLVYRKTERLRIELEDPEHEAKRSQKRALDAFVDRWFGSAQETFRHAFMTFQTTNDFEEQLRAHLEQLIRQRLPEHFVMPAERETDIVWLHDSPYRGLEVFDFEHREIFRGRRATVNEIKAKLVQKATEENCAFLVVIGASGCGKSSLVRAGLLPAICDPGSVEGVDLWRRCIFRPSDAADLSEGLATALLGETGLPELVQEGTSTGELATLLRDHPQGARPLLRLALRRVARAEGAREARLVVVVDQLEELFTLERVTTEQRKQFVAALADLARSGHVWVIATMRCDFFHRCIEIDGLDTLMSGHGQHILRKPTRAQIGQMIREPSRAAGLAFESNPDTGESLDELLEEEAAAHPEALPLLEFTLEKLYAEVRKRGSDRVLTLKDYRNIGGLQGALTQHAEEVLSKLAPEVQAALPSLFRELVTVDDDDEHRVAARRASWSKLLQTETSAKLLKAFVDARLLVARGVDDEPVVPSAHEPVVALAHEALLRNWKRLGDWVAENREFLQTRTRVDASAIRWREEQRSLAFLLAPGKPLEEAVPLLQRPSDLSDLTIEYVEASRRRVTRARFSRYFALAAVMSGLLVFSFVTARQKSTLQHQTQQLVRITTDLTNAQGAKIEGDLGVFAMRTLKAQYLGNLSVAPWLGSRVVEDRVRAVSQDRLGEIMLRENQTDEALKRCKDAVEIGKRLVARDHQPDDVRNLALFYGTLGDVYTAREEHGAALQAYDRSRDLTAGLQAHGEARDRVALMYRLVQLGDSYRCQTPPKVDEALKAYDDAVRLGTKPTATDIPAKRNLAAAYDAKGITLDALGEDEAALVAYQAAFQVLTQLVGRPDSAEEDRMRLKKLKPRLEKIREAVKRYAGSTPAFVTMPARSGRLH